MNWRRGFFRLWAVFSVIWIVGYLAVERVDQLVTMLVTSSKSYTATQSATVAVAQHTGIEPPPSGFYLIDDLERIRNNATKLQDDRADPATVNAYLQKEGLTPELFRSYQAERLRNALIDEIQSRVVRHTAILIGVPLMLLVFGMLVGWIVRGFRRI